jgi:AcrR family transcriptional regulator
MKESTMVEYMPEMDFDKTAARRSNINKRIIEASEKVFLEKGYRLASIDEIAQLADITKRTMYKRFSSKLALFIYMLDGYLITLKNELSSIKRKKAGSGASCDVERNIKALFDFTLRNEKFMRLYWILDSNEFDGQIPAELVEHVKKLTEQIFEVGANLIKKDLAKGMINDVDPILLIHLLSAVNKGIFIHASKEKRFEIADIKPQELFDLLLVILKNGLFARGDKGGAG